MLSKRTIKQAIPILLGMVLLASCTTAQKGAAVGGAAGAGLGAIIGKQAGGHTAEGAGIGAAVGAVTGAIVGEQLETKFCPVCGRRYTGGKLYCPIDGTELKQIEK